MRASAPQLQQVTLQLGDALLHVFHCTRDSCIRCPHFFVSCQPVVLAISSPRSCKSLQARLRHSSRLRTISKDMKKMGSTMHGSESRLTRTESHQPHGRDPEERERRRREWVRQQEREREHERFKRKKIEEWERKRRAEEKKNDKRRSSYRSRSGSTGRSSGSQRRVVPPVGVTKPSVMSQKFEPSSNNTRLFKGPESTIVDVAELRRIKVDIHRNIPAAEMSTELRREILDPEDVKLKRREGSSSLGRSHR